MVTERLPWQQRRRGSSKRMEQIRDFVWILLAYKRNIHALVILVKVRLNVVLE